MAAWVCVECTTVYAVGASRCPQCGSVRYVEQGEPMPKNTVHGGPSNRFAEPTDAGVVIDAPAAAAPAPDEGGEQSSPGNSSSPSSEKPQTSSEQSAPALRKRARTTGSRSKKAPTGSSSAAGTDGDPTDGTSAADGGEG